MISSIIQALFIKIQLNMSKKRNEKESLIFLMPNRSKEIFFTEKELFKEKCVLYTTRINMQILNTGDSVIQVRTFYY